MVAVTDRERCDLLIAEQELEVISILVDHASLSVVAYERMSWALCAIRVALDVRRADVGLPQRQQDLAA